MSRFVHKEARITLHGICEDAKGRKSVTYSVDIYDEDDKKGAALLNSRVLLGGEIRVLRRGDGRFSVNGHPMGMAAPVWDDDE